MHHASPAANPLPPTPTADFHGTAAPIMGTINSVLIVLCGCGSTVVHRCSSACILHSKPSQRFLHMWVFAKAVSTAERPVNSHCNRMHDGAKVSQQVTQLAILPALTHATPLGLVQASCPWQNVTCASAVVHHNWGRAQAHMPLQGHTCVAVCITHGMCPGVFCHTAQGA